MRHGGECMIEQTAKAELPHADELRSKMTPYVEPDPAEGFIASCETYLLEKIQDLLYGHKVIVGIRWSQQDEWRASHDKVVQHFKDKGYNAAIENNTLRVWL